MSPVSTGERSVRLASDLAQLVDGRLMGPEQSFDGVAPLAQAGPNEVAYVEGVLPPECAAGVLLIREAIPGRCCIQVDDPKTAFITLLNSIFSTEFEPGIHPTAVIHKTAKVREDAQVGPFVVVGAGCTVGSKTVLHPHVVLYPGTVVGDGVVVHAGTVLGADGFSYHPGSQGLQKVPQVGNVMIADGVEIGANSCVDRAFLETTSVGRGAKIDNLVQVGHNSRIGKNAVIAAQTGLSGSVQVGDWAQLGGQVGVADHVSIGTGTRVGAKSGVSRDLDAGKIYLGKNPAQPAGAFRRMVGAMRKLPELWTRLRKLEARVSDLEDG